MTRPVKIKKIADALDSMMDEWVYYLNRETGEIVEIEKEYLSIAEESEEDEDFGEYKDWEQDAIRDAVKVLENPEDYIKLPDEYEIDEYNIMMEFCCNIPNKNLREKLLNLISGRGAFRRFKDAIKRYNIEDEWYKYRFEELCKMAREWCEDNNLPYIND